MSWRVEFEQSAPATPGSPEPGQVPGVGRELDPDQRRVVEHRSGPLLVLAGPGTGKTTTIVEAIAARLADPLDPLPADALLALTFGRRAALDLRDRIGSRIGGGVLPWVSTFHSFAYALLRQTATVDEYLHPPRLMSGAEEDVRIRELLRGAVVDGSVDWPEDLMGALPTLGLANEVRAVLARARELGLDGDALARIGRSSGRPAWRAVGQLARQELDVMALENVLDYGELVLRAVQRAREPDVQRVLHGRFRAVYIDEYQDTDPLQVALVRALVGPGSTLVAVGDPDQAIYGFRGADVDGLLSFPATFRTSDGEPAPVVVLRRARRFGPRIRAAADVALGTRLPRGLPVEVMRRHRTPECAPVADPENRDQVDLRTYGDRGAQAAHVARSIRQAHVRRGVPWSQMAVIVRMSSEIAPVERALRAAGVPVVVSADDVPLRQEPAVEVLLDLLDLAVHPSAASPSRISDVLTGPVVGLSPGDVRRLGRALRASARRAGLSAPSSSRLIRDLVVSPLLQEPGPVEGLPESDPVRAAVRRLTGLLIEAREQIESGAPPQEVLWTVWTGGRQPHGWPDRLRSAALAGHRAAHHDLDAVLALFDTADRLAGRYPGFLGVRTFLDILADQQLPAESVAERAVDAEAVRILTAHRAKGLEWDEVWVVGIQEGTWPDLRARGSTLRAEELTETGVGAGARTADLLEEERRLLYVACTRARHRLHLSAVDAPDESGDRPSRLLLDIARASDVDLSRPVVGRPRHASSLEGIVAELRAVAMDPDSDASLRDGAVQRLALLTRATDDDDRPLVPWADPQTWWGGRESTRNDRPRYEPDAPVPISGSMLDTVLQCPLTWFLEREVHAETPRGSATSFGSIVHAVADFVAKGEVPAEPGPMQEAVDRIWGELAFDARWQSEAERARAGAALDRFLDYHRRADRALLGTEVPVRAVVPVSTPSGAVQEVRLSGVIDRIERDSEGRLVAIDLKNMKQQVPVKDIPEHGQLGIYQMLLEHGDLDADIVDEPSPRPVGGAALVQLRLDEGRGSTAPKVQFQQPIPSEGSGPTWVELKLGQAAEVLRDDTIRATVGSACRFCAFATACPAQSEGEQVTP